MKRFSLVLLSFLMCFLMFSCDDYTHTPSVSSENTSSETVSDTSSQEVTSSESISSAEENQRNENTNLLNRDYGQSQPETQEIITIDGELYQSYVDEDTTLRYVFMTKNEYSELSMFWHWKKDKLWDWIPIGTAEKYSLDLVGVIYEGDEGEASLPNTVKDPSQRDHDIGELQTETQEFITIDGQSYQSYVNSASGLRHIFMSREEYVQLSGDELPDWKWAFIEVGTADVYSLDFIPFINASQK